MADRPPPSRYSVVERGGRLVVIDRETGTVPLTAAERMAEHDRRMGHEPSARPAPRPSPAPAAAQRPAAQAARNPAPQKNPPRAQLAPSKQTQAPKQGAAERPWHRPVNPAAMAAAKPAPAPAKNPGNPVPVLGVTKGRKTIVTGKWWDSKGPRTIELGEQGQATLTGGLTMIGIIAFVVTVILLFVQPALFFVIGFLMLRFGGSVLAPIGAGIIDKAIAEKG